MGDNHFHGGGNPQYVMHDLINAARCGEVKNSAVTVVSSIIKHLLQLYLSDVVISQRENGSVIEIIIRDSEESVEVRDRRLEEERLARLEVEVRQIRQTKAGYDVLGLTYEDWDHMPGGS